MKSNDIHNLLSNHEIWHIQEFFEDLETKGIDGRQEWHINYFKSELIDAIPINKEIRIEITYVDKNNNESLGEFNVSPPHREGGWLWWTHSGFIFEPRIIMYKLLPPETIYSIILTPENSSKRTYKLSHYIKPQEPERFHFCFVSEKSAKYKLRFHFIFNEKNKISSAPIILHLTTENNNNVLQNFKDGQMLTYENGEIKLN